MCAVTPLQNVFSNEWITGHNEAILTYGWDESILEGQDKIFESLRKNFEAEHTSQTWDENETWTVLQRVSSLLIFNRINGSQVTEAYGRHYAQLACGVAADAIATATCKMISGHRRLGQSLVSSSFKDKALVKGLLSRDGFPVDAFHEQALNRLFPGSSTDSKDLIISLDGFVAGYSILWGPSTKQSEILDIRICVGHIRREEFAYESIRESSIPETSFYASPEPLSLQIPNGFGAIEPRREPRLIRVESLISVSGPRLELRTSLRCTNPDGTETRRRVSWIQSIWSLATAHHVGCEHELNPMQSTLISQRLYNDGLEAFWAPTFHYGPDNDDMRKRVLQTFNNEELRFFVAGIMQAKLSPWSQCWTLVVSHSASVLACIHAGEKVGRP